MASRLLAIATVAVVALLAAPFGAAAQFTVSTPLVIGVDHADLANQQPDQHRLFEYTDFFLRSVSIHTGDFLDFRAAPGSFHIVALAANETVARKVYPVAYAETVDSQPAAGSGVAKLAFGPSNFPITGGSTHGGGTITFTSGFGPPVCGVQALGQQPCTFKGGDDIEVIGPTPGFVGAVFSDPPAQPTFVDQKMQIIAPPGTYTYFCYLHPKMSGTLTVVDASQPATTQAQVDAASQTQFAADQAAGLAAEQAANVVKFTGGAPGTRTYQVSVGAGSPDTHVAIDEMLPQAPISLSPGDTVQYTWIDTHNIHSVTFPTTDPRLPEPFGFDCATGYVGIPLPPKPSPPPCLLAGAKQPEAIGDPGNSPPGSALVDPTQVVDAGVLAGTAYGVTPSAQQWSLTVNAATKPGTYNYQCTIHDWMHGTLQVAAPTATAPTPVPVQVPAKLPPTGSGGSVLVWTGWLALLCLIAAGLGGRWLISRR